MVSLGEGNDGTSVAERRGSQSAISGNEQRPTAVATSNETISQPTQGTVSSMRTWAMRQTTIRFTAIGGVNWPIAIFIVSSTPNQTGSQLKANDRRISSGRRIRKIETPSRNMPTTISSDEQQDQRAVVAEARG